MDGHASVEIREFAIDTAAVLVWGLPRLRDLPWRATRDPWQILVAEVMLQQTGTERVIPKWHEFLALFPTPSACAEASLGDVLRLWQGLGYPRRAVYLHTTARHIRDDHAGEVPDDLVQLLALPGIGAYTARALLAFAFERDVAVVDTNIARILARTVGHRLTPKQAQWAADDLVPPHQGWGWNQVLIDLGATVCRPSPHCGECPAAPDCAWHQDGHAQPDPAKGSAGASRVQPRYEGSDRQRRGVVLGALGEGERSAAEFDQHIVAGLVDDGLIVRHGDVIRLPH